MTTHRAVAIASAYAALAITTTGGSVDDAVDRFLVAFDAALDDARADGVAEFMDRVPSDADIVEKAQTIGAEPDDGFPSDYAAAFRDGATWMRAVLAGIEKQGAGR